MSAMVSRSPRQRPVDIADSEAPDVLPSVLGPRSAIRGVVEIEGDLTVLGAVKGRIMALRLIIAAGGYVEGDIIARDLLVNGRLKGRVFAPTVSIEASAEVEGRIFHSSVTVAQGAKVTGRMPWRPPSYFESLDRLPEARP